MPIRPTNWLAEHRSLLAVMAFSLLLKMVLVMIGREINPDGVLYIASAQQYAAGNFSEGLALYRMPAFPLLIAGIHSFIPNWIAAARSITIASMVLASLPLYKITERLFDRRAALWAALFLAVAPEANENALRVLRDPTFLLVSLSAAFFVVRGLQAKQLRWIAVGFVFGCVALLFRVEGVVILAAPPLYFLILALSHKEASTRSLALKSAAFWIGVPLGLGLLMAVFYGPALLSNNRIDEVAAEVQALVGMSAFEKYRQIYDFFSRVQDEPPFSGFPHSLPGTVRHWMPLVYLIGLLESLAKQLYPLFLLPLFLSSWKRYRLKTQAAINKRFIFAVFCGYMLLLFYFLITRDRMVGRLLLTPAILLYPWVGHGFRSGLKALDGHKFNRAIQTAVILLFIVLPVVKNVQNVIESDRSAMVVGRFIANDPILQDDQLLFSETNHAFYAGRLENFAMVREAAKQIDQDLDEGRTEAIAALIKEHNADSLVLFVNLQKNQSIPTFTDYAEYTRIRGQKGVTVIYRAKE